MKFQKVISSWALISLLGCGMLPTINAYAFSLGGTCEESAAPSEEPMSTLKVDGESVSFPQDEWTTIGTYTMGANAGFSVQNEQGDSKQVNLNTAAQMVGLSSSQIAQLSSTLPAQSTVVYGRFSPINGLMDVEALRVSRVGHTVTLARSKFTPYMGNRWAASKTYMTADEKTGNPGPGPNPFACYEGGDGEFHNVPMTGTPQAFAILGVAARHYNAQIAYLNEAFFDYKVWSTTSHHLFTTTTTIHHQGNEKPIWYVGLPPAMVDQNAPGLMYTGMAICLEGSTTCSAQEHLVKSGLAWQNWTDTGGNLPSQELTVHEFDESHTGLNMLVFAIIITVVSYGAFAGYALAAGTALSTASGGALASLVTSGLTAAGVTGATALGLGVGLGAALDGLAYLGIAMAVQGSGPLSTDTFLGGVVGTDSTSKWTAQDQYEPYFQQVESDFVTAPPGQDNSVANSNGVFQQDDNAYQNSIQPGVSTNMNFNSDNYIKDTQ